MRNPVRPTPPRRQSHPLRHESKGLLAGIYRVLMSAETRQMQGEILSDPTPAEAVSRFRNPEDGRLRAGWRILAFLGIFYALALPAVFGLRELLQFSKSSPLVVIIIALTATPGRLSCPALVRQEELRFPGPAFRSASGDGSAVRLVSQWRHGSLRFHCYVVAGLHRQCACCIAWFVGRAGPRKRITHHDFCRFFGKSSYSGAICCRTWPKVWASNWPSSFHVCFTERCIP